MLTKLLYLYAILLLLPFCSYGMTLDRTAEAILKGSPAYKAENYSLESLSATVKTENNLPDPQLEGEYLFAPKDEPNRWGAELSWAIEWPGVYGARGKEAESKLTAAQKNLYSQRLERLIEIKKLLLDYVLCRKRLLLLEDLSRNNDSIYRLSEESARGGELTALDLNKIRLEYVNIRGAKATLLDEEATLISQLGTLSGIDCTSLLQDMDCEFPEVRIPTHQEIEEISGNALAVEAARAEVESLRHNSKVLKMESLPSLSIGYKHAYEDNIHFNGPTIGVSIPLFSARGKKEAVKAALDEAQYKVESTEKGIETELHLALKRLLLAKSQLDEIDHILQSSDHNSILLKAYKGGIITVVEYLTERNYFTNAAEELLTLRHAAAVAQMEISKYFTALEF